MATWRTRLAALGLGGVLAAALAYAFLAQRPQPATVRFEPLRLPPVESRGAPPSAARGARRALSAAELGAVTRPHPMHQVHPNGLYHYRAWLRTPVRFPEHPDGTILSSTNDCGFKGSQPVRRDAPGLRVLVLGDSHTDGVCTHAETYCSLVEAALRTEGHDAEVLNAAVGGHTFDHYLAGFERAAPLEPAVVLVTVYGGNDFYETLPFAWVYSGTDQPADSREHVERLSRAVAFMPFGVGQALAQTHYFASQPAMVEVALEAACARTSELVELCRARGAVPVFAYLPSAAEVAWRHHAALRDAADALELVPADHERVAQLARRWREHTQSLGVQLVDLRGALAELTPSPYWFDDQHLNVGGHAAVARELFGVLRELADSAAQSTRTARAAVPRGPQSAGEAALKLAACAAAVDALAAATAPVEQRAAPVASGVGVATQTDDDRGALAGPSSTPEFPVRAVPDCRLPRERVEQLFGLEAPRVFDEHSHFVHAAVAPYGAGGLLELPTSAAAEGPRVLVLGDETLFEPGAGGRPFATHLAQLAPGRYEDATTPGYGPFQYLGALRRRAEFEPEVVVVVLNGADDALDALELWRELARGEGAPADRTGSAPARAARSTKALRTDEERARRLSERAASGANAVRAAVDVLTELDRACRERGARPLFVVLPPPTHQRFSPSEDWKRRVQRDGAPAQDENQLGILERIYGSLLDALAQRGLQASVPLRSLPRDSGRLYLPGSSSLSEEGRALLAQALAPELAR